MSFIADLHIHSHYSIATSKLLVPEYLDAWARIKGISVVGTGDITHPGWLAELKEKLVAAEPGLYRLKTPFKGPEPLHHTRFDNDSVRFLLTAEISNIYKRGDKTRKVHNVVMMPSFESAERLQARLDEIGNITSDGRPILGLDSRDLLEICLEVDENMLFVPAHIWTPWFSALGSKSGFDTIDEAYADLAHHIQVVETGLSADPPMHWMASHLDRFAIMSNSDAHSPEKLGREANILDTELSFDSIVSAFKENDKNRLRGTIEFFPQEGKYHFDGHRKCQVAWDPVQTLQNDAICSVCGKRVTVGVMHRAVALSDRAALPGDDIRSVYTSVIPLKEILSEIEGVGPNSKRITRLYHQLIDRLGAELPLLTGLPLDTVAEAGGEVLAEAVGRVRRREVFIEEGYDGEYGRITVFGPHEKRSAKTQVGLFAGDAESDGPQARPILPFDMARVRELMKHQQGEPEQVELMEKRPAGDNELQQQAIAHEGGPALVVAGPGTGKTRVLTQRIASLIKSGTPASHILALTFTNKAAREMAERLDALLGDADEKPLVTTFHGLGYRLLTEFESNGGAHHLLDRPAQERVIAGLLDCSQADARQLAGHFSDAKRKLRTPEAVEEGWAEQFRLYEQHKRKTMLWDLDDLIVRMVQLLEKNITALTTLAERWPVVLIDEYQDVNEAQYRLVRLLSPSGRSNLMVIGDPHQAIYSFRGADAIFLHRFQQDYPRCRVYRLQRSYRCSDTILSASRDVLALPQAHALSGLYQGVTVKIAEQHSEKSEAEFIARSIEALSGGLRFFSMDSDITTGGDAEIDSLGQVAVLCRTRQQFGAIEKAFFDHAIPYQQVGMRPFFQEAPIRSLMLMAHWLWSESHPVVEDEMADQHPAVYAQRARWVHAVAGLEVAPALQLLADPLGLAQSADLPRLLRMAAVYGRDKKRFLREMALGQGADTYEHSLERVSLMTLHAAKGLEFDVVFIPGCEENLLPYRKSGSPVNIEEERRLLYVGMTRARHLLYLSHARHRLIFGQRQHQMRSHFLDSIEKTLLEEMAVEKRAPEKKASDQLGLF